MCKSKVTHFHFWWHIDSGLGFSLICNHTAKVLLISNQDIRYCTVSFLAFLLRFVLLHFWACVYHALFLAFYLILVFSVVYLLFPCGLMQTTAHMHMQIVQVEVTA